MNILAPLFALLAGTMTALQVVINSQARARLTVEGGAEIHPFQATLVNFSGGTILLIAICLVARFAWPTSETFIKAPWWIWTGGVLGIVYVYSSVVLGPKLGVALFFTLVVAGQMVGSLIIDEFGVLGSPVKAANWGRLLGVALVLGGAMLVAFSTGPSTPPTPVESVEG